MELSCFETHKSEADLEVSIVEFYYSAKSCFREHEKGSVCEKVANGKGIICSICNYLVFTVSGISPSENI